MSDKTELENVNVGDIFLFFGWFKDAERDKDKNWKYARGARDKHVIYGYFEIGEILKGDSEIKKRFPNHAHALDADNPADNRLFVPQKDPDGTFHCGAFRYSKELDLTKEGKTMSIWKLPKFFADPKIRISRHDKRERFIDCGDHLELHSVYPGQEFVIETEDAELQKELENWTKNIINAGMPVK